MSTLNVLSSRLSQLEVEGELVRYVPRIRRAKRRLYLHKRAVAELTSSTSTFAVLGLQGRIRDVLERWTVGDRVWTDAEGKPRFLKPLFPPAPNVWEMLMTEPRAQVRMFFVFAEPDTIFMSYMRTRSFLGRRSSQNWKEAKSECIATWNALFPYPPFQGSRITDYVTENCDVFSI